MDSTPLDMSVVKEELEDNNDFEQAAELVADPDVSDFAAAVPKAEHDQGHAEPEINDVAPGQVESLSELGPFDEFLCQECRTPIGLPASKVVGSHMLWCKRGDVFCCPLCTHQHKQAEAFNLHTVTHCFSGEGQAVFCGNCSKQYLWLDDPIASCKPIIKFSRQCDKYGRKRQGPSSSAVESSSSSSAPMAQNQPQWLNKAESSEQNLRMDSLTMRGSGAKRVPNDLPPQTHDNSDDRTVNTLEQSCQRYAPTSRLSGQECSVNVNDASTGSTSTQLDLSVVKEEFEDNHSLEQTARPGVSHFALKAERGQSDGDSEDDVKPEIAYIALGQVTLLQGVSGPSDEFPSANAIPPEKSSPNCSSPKTQNKWPRKKAKSASQAEIKCKAEPRSRALQRPSCDVCGKSFRKKTALQVHKRMAMHTEKRHHICSKCGERFSTEGRLHSHTTSVHNVDHPHKCTTCDKSFQLENALTRHIHSHTDEQSHGYSCDECGKTCRTSADLQLHRASHAKPEPKLKCPHCQDLFTRRCSLTVHIRTHMGEGSYPCDICNKRFKTGYQRIKHFKSDHNTVREITRPVCDTKFTRKKAAKEHMSLHNKRDNFREAKPRAGAILDLSCAICSKTFTRNYSLTLHMRIHTGERPYSCAICGKGFITKAQLFAHVRTHSPSYRLYKCSSCDKSFKRKDSLTRHMHSHRDERRYICEECGKTYRTSSDLRNHRVTHAEPKPSYICPHCPKQFSRHYSLTVHIRTHTGDCPYPCEICSKRFRTSSHRRDHMKEHNTVRDIKCPICNMEFARKIAAKKHMSLHKKENQFGCLDCGAILPDLDELKTHMDTHDDRHTCEICGMSFSRRDSLTVHVRIHTGERPFKCTVCPEVFHSSKKLRSHVKLVHN